MQTTIAPDFFARSIPSAPKWSKWPWEAVMTSSLPSSNPFGNFGFFSMNGSRTTRFPSPVSTRKHAWPSHVTFPENCAFIFPPARCPPARRSGRELLPRDRRQERVHEPFQPGAVLLVETTRFGGVHVEHSDEGPSADDRDDDLRPRRGVAGNVPGKFVHVGNDEGLLVLRRRPAHALAQRNPHASRLPLERPENELAPAQQIKP